MSQSDNRRAKAVCYLRVARGTRGFVFNATTKPSSAPLNTGGYGAEPLVTRQFKLVLDLPLSAFNAVDGTVEVDVPEDVLEEVIRAQAEEVPG